MQSNRKNNLLIYFFIMFILIAVCSAKQIEQRKLESYTSSYYLKFLDNILIPSIEEYIDNNELMPYTKEKGEVLVAGVVEIIHSHLSSDNILIQPEMKYMAVLLTMPSDNNLVIYYFLNISLPIVEYDQKGKIPSFLMISKNFFCGMEQTTPKKKI